LFTQGYTPTWSQMAESTCLKGSSRSNSLNEQENQDELLVTAAQTHLSSPFSNFSSDSRELEGGVRSMGIAYSS